MEAINAYLKTLPMYSLTSLLEAALQAINKEWSRYALAQMAASAISQNQPHISSHVSDKVQSSMDDALSLEAFRSAETSGRVAGLAEGICTMSLNYLQKLTIQHRASTVPHLRYHDG